MRYITSLAVISLAGATSAHLGNLEARMDGECCPCPGSQQGNNGVVTVTVTHAPPAQTVYVTHGTTPEPTENPSGEQPGKDDAGMDEPGTGESGDDGTGQPDNGGSDSDNQVVTKTVQPGGGPGDQAGETEAPAGPKTVTVKIQPATPKTVTVQASEEPEATPSVVTVTQQPEEATAASNPNGNGNQVVTKTVQPSSQATEAPITDGSNPNGSNGDGTNPDGTNGNGTGSNPDGTNGIDNGALPDSTNGNGNGNGTNDNGTNPDGTNGNGTGSNPDGTDGSDNGTNENGSNPDSTNGNGSNPDGTNGNGNGSGNGNGNGNGSNPNGTDGNDNGTNDNGSNPDGTNGNGTGSNPNGTNGNGTTDDGTKAEPSIQTVTRDGQITTVTAAPSTVISDHYQTVTQTVSNGPGNIDIEVTIINIDTGATQCIKKDSGMPCDGDNGNTSQSTSEIACPPVTPTTSIATVYHTVTRTAGQNATPTPMAKAKKPRGPAFPRWW